MLTKVTKDLRVWGPGEVDGAALGFVGQAIGDLAFYDGDAWGLIPAGDEGQQLTIGGNLIPGWAAAAGDFVAYDEPVAALTIDLTEGFDPDFPVMDYYYQVVPSIDANDTLHCRLSQDGGLTFVETTDYRTINYGYDSLAASRQLFGAALSSIRLNNQNNMGNVDGEATCGHIRLIQPQDPDQFAKVEMETCTRANSTAVVAQQGGGQLSLPGVVDGLQILALLGSTLTGWVLTRRMSNAG